ncbi:CTP synthase [Candidatus Kaiserbacteria bacterium CG_4_8_14_3_um_filter_50_23]|uniref:CTP synthase n=1 Tax=Candidatus Kaiserbacteria bacterium CG08_land_8_20_14_0_20_50_21 TaxID=1974604 RepID=A0A2H0Z0R9_9BACT|nr:MAG: CTP synthase [Candidatus Kaiserbacteria bacterium CG08_land_8_20_14_0_20_50_21]PIU81979.1 MAG: CTP synthase [Candidatus Kaiserbacteria bacterium CG06_land_8_20_14_3_00_49_31]PIW96237.1 MAG: CTP synthase [Candidatus Kaiserbacteria bacterium CG_4_8_14_3_um_filter_50_23]PJA00056.1 MAG: CTP synthase [Candidatus Kaiserbacteria bacterium CG_4_10_14_0_2_um_filter_50_16]
MAKEGHKYIFVLGGVMSGVGKGVVTSSIGLLLQQKGYPVNLVKVDPYLNVDAGTMNPTEHGEVFVLRSGMETDQDMGNYERFLGRDLTNEDYMTSGMVYQSVISRERALEYDGKCVEAIPHVRDEILRRIEAASSYNGSRISVVEIGGTIGDFQNALFIEAARILKMKHPEDVLFVIVSYLPTPGTLGEMKTKPTQTAVRDLNSYGVQPDFIIARSKEPIDEKRKEKLAIWCNVSKDHIIAAPDIGSIYEAPLNFEKDKLGDAMLDALRLPEKKRASLAAWKKFALAAANTKIPEVSIAIVGKYFDTGDFVLSDAYLSVIEAIKFSAAKLNRHARITWVNSKDLERGAKVTAILGRFNGIIVPGGFGETGIEGKIKAIQFARVKKIPYFGLCYGMQLMVVEYARHVLGLSDANTTEIKKSTSDPVVDVMLEQKKHLADNKYGGTMRLGVYPAYLKKGTMARAAYKKELVEERHRHRYEINPAYVKHLEAAGLVFSGTSPDGVLMEIAELPRSVHPFMLGTQFHPEFHARPLSPHPLFTEFLRAAITRKRKK